MTARNLYPGVLAAVFVAVFIGLAIAPVSRTVWIAEAIPVVIVFAVLVLGFPVFRFSNTAYSLMAVWLFWHTVGSHYTFANVPFGWVSELLGTERNHFDRIAHFSVGFYAFPMMEWLLRRRHCGIVTAGFFAVFFIMSIAAGYEIIEWWFAVVAGGDAGVEFLGAQGDVWDAQKDMLADTLGAILVVVLYLVVRPDRSRS